MKVGSSCLQTIHGCSTQYLVQCGLICVYRRFCSPLQIHEVVHLVVFVALSEEPSNRVSTEIPSLAIMTHSRHTLQRYDRSGGSIVRFLPKILIPERDCLLSDWWLTGPCDTLPCVVKDVRPKMRSGFMIWTSRFLNKIIFKSFLKLVLACRVLQ